VIRAAVLALLLTVAVWFGGLPAVFAAVIAFPSSGNSAADKINEDLADFVGGFYDDPLGFVENCYPWGVEGTALADETGPDTWQREALEEIGRQVRARAFDGSTAVDPNRIVVSSGHGIGKSTLQAWLVDWIMSTRPACRGTITANTSTQLDTKTWAAIVHWTKLCITAPWFEVNTARMYFKGQRENWFCAPQSCKEENSEAFAGQHAKASTSFYIIDEGSAVPDKIYEVAEGGLTDGEPMIFVFGNPTRNTGAFYRAAFGSDRNRWIVYIIDSRNSKFTNKKWIADLLASDYCSGNPDSDVFRVRVRGLPPAASDLQFIDSKSVTEAQAREVLTLSDDPLVCGFDVARGGADNCVFWFRRGPDARSIKRIVIPGDQARDTMRLATVATEVLTKEYEVGPGKTAKVAKLFIDATGGSVGGPLYDRLVQLGYGEQCVEVQFGSESPDEHYANMRAYMWGKMRDWLKRGAIPNDPRLETDLTGPHYGHDKRDRLLLESKEHMKNRGVDSPDLGDGLALTFAYPVSPAAAKAPKPYRPRSTWG
jgi:hypothetical protein